ncbi:MAG: DUF2203 family protein [Candidatus Gracilibacteria bacterium]
MKKTFNLYEANRALVFVAPVTADIARLFLTLEGAENSQKDVETLHKIQNCINELKQVGCICRDPKIGLIDFPSFYKNEPVFLCWQLGEDEIVHYHGLQNCLGNRQTIDEDFVRFNCNAPLEFAGV